MQAYTTDVCAHLQIGNSNLLECKSAHVTRAFFYYYFNGLYM